MKHVLAMLVLLASPADDVARCYTVNAAASEAGFEAEQAGMPFSGSFSEFGGEICMAGSVPTRIDAWLAPGSVDSGLAELDAVLQDEEFFATAEYPRARFVSEDIAPGAKDGEWQARGELTLKGVTHAITVPLVTQQTATGMTASGTVSIERLQFDVGTGEWADTEWLGGTVVVMFRAVLEREGEAR